MAVETLPKPPPLVVLLLLVIAYLRARMRSGEEILRVKMEVERLRERKDSIESVVARHGEAQRQLTR